MKQVGISMMVQPSAPVKRQEINCASMLSAVRLQPDFCFLASLADKHVCHGAAVAGKLITDWLQPGKLHLPALRSCMTIIGTDLLSAVQFHLL